jgi:hypothetical protein
MFITFRFCWDWEFKAKKIQAQYSFSEKWCRFAPICFSGPLLRGNVPLCPQIWPVMKNYSTGILGLHQYHNSKAGDRRRVVQIQLHTVQAHTEQCWRSGWIFTESGWLKSEFFALNKFLLKIPSVQNRVVDPDPDPGARKLRNFSGEKKFYH